MLQRNDQVVNIEELLLRQLRGQEGGSPELLECQDFLPLTLVPDSCEHLPQLDLLVGLVKVDVDVRDNVQDADFVDLLDDDAEHVGEAILNEKLEFFLVELLQPLDQVTNFLE